MRCAEFFPYSTYFEGSHSSVSPNSVLKQICENTENGSSNHSVIDHNVDSIASNGKLEAFKNLTIWQSWTWANRFASYPVWMLGKPRTKLDMNPPKQLGCNSLQGSYCESFGAGCSNFWKQVGDLFSMHEFSLSNWFAFLWQMCIILPHICFRVEFFIGSPDYPFLFVNIHPVFLRDVRGGIASLSKAYHLDRRERLSGRACSQHTYTESML